MYLSRVQINQVMMLKLKLRWVHDRGRWSGEDLVLNLSKMILNYLKVKFVLITQYKPDLL